MLLEPLIVRMFGLHVYRKFEFEDIGDKFSPISSLFHVVKGSHFNVATRSKQQSWIYDSHLWPN